jgi:hypothetical protein
VANATVEAYDYDSVIQSFFASTSCSSSCDALLLKDHLYLIEFKSLGKGVDILAFNLNTLSTKKFDQALRVICKAEFKLCESLYMLEKRILRPLAVDESKFEKHAVIVYASNEFAAAGRAAALASASSQPPTPSMHQRFEGRDADGNPVFYHRIQTIPDILFAQFVKGFQ